jgi:rhodanese-related sulfurtransferase
MPSAPVLETAQPDPAIEPSARGREHPHGAPVLHVVPAPTAVPLATIAVPTAPTARIHWIGPFVDARQPADVFADILAGRTGMVVVDARWPESFSAEHIPTAINLPFRSITEETTANLSREPLYVVYCWDESCRASARVAARLEHLGFRVKELHGGLQSWKKQGYPTERA